MIVLPYQCLNWGAGRRGRNSYLIPFLNSPQRTHSRGPWECQAPPAKAGVCGCWDPTEFSLAAHPRMGPLSKLALQRVSMPTPAVSSTYLGIDQSRFRGKPGWHSEQNYAKSRNVGNQLRRSSKESWQGRSLTWIGVGGQAKPGAIPELRSWQVAVYLVSHTCGKKHNGNN